MRQIILDTETTGLEWKKGNRVVEIGCVELIERRPSGRTYHQYINPQREFEQGAAEVTGLSLDFLSDKPLFADIADEFLAFVDGAEIIIHNAAFDVGFLDYELSLLGEHYGRLRDRASVEDSLLMARQRFPGQRNSLDALCKRLGVDNTHRQLHGALLDAQLLCEVYLHLTSGQSEIGFDGLEEKPATVVVAVSFADLPASARPRVQPTGAELNAHAARLEVLRKKAGGRCIWDGVEIEAAVEA
ncbi:DNA polymerase III subunit epsilon [Pseudoxanthomonas dokdonensis]|uniref:DNA polymerase III subunit epsilon n=1 Tax=Pseudoxanthomonas dokdonensis TaxID=344882 RepID=A0A0R0CR06_9GAMM|nr:DNA polymerase III subunit epsilon [Pseudoxanthomonas dokdonensis]KRG68081.1 DNA polymerase III subunit epsilon [Pseudoxanthomonas dokdonensis]